MKAKYFAETDGFSGVSTYAKGLLEELSRLEVDVERIKPFKFLKPGFLNSLLINPIKLYLADGDLIHITSQDYLATFLPLPSTELAVTVHDIFPYTSDYSGPVYSFLSSLYVKKLEKNADLIFAVSEFTRQQLVEHTEVEDEKIEVVYQGVNLEKFREADESVEYTDYHLHVGSELGRKNIEGLIEIFSEIKSRNPEKILVRVGEVTRTAREAIKKNDLELGEDVIYLSGISDEELVRLYSNADKLLFPSHAEGFGRPMVESLACGTPVLAYDRQPMSEILPAEMLCDDREEFIQKSFDLEFSSKQCRSIAANYTWEKTAEKIVEGYRKI